MRCRWERTGRILAIGYSPCWMQAFSERWLNESYVAAVQAVICRKTEVLAQNFIFSVQRPMVALIAS